MGMDVWKLPIPAASVCTQAVARSPARHLSALRCLNEIMVDGWGEVSVMNEVSARKFGAFSFQYKRRLVLPHMHRVACTQISSFQHG